MHASERVLLLDGLSELYWRCCRPFGVGGEPDVVHVTMGGLWLDEQIIRKMLMSQPDSTMTSPRVLFGVCCAIWGD
jgi:hypothetical protein